MKDTIAASSRQINLKEVLSYELSTTPFALAHQDGSLRKNTKSDLAKMLEEQVEVLPCLLPSAPETIFITDGMAVGQMMKSAGASTFGEMASIYFTSMVVPLLQTSNCDEVHIVFDQYERMNKEQNQSEMVPNCSPANIG